MMSLLIRARRLLAASAVPMAPLAREVLAGLIAEALREVESVALLGAAAHLGAAMDDVERLSPAYTDRLRVADVRRLADELESLTTTDPTSCALS